MMQSSSLTANSSSVDDSIKVLVRIRPSDVTAFSSSSTASSIPATPRKTLSRDANAFEIEENTVHEPKGNLAFTFDHVSKQNAAQSEIFDFCGQSSVDSYLEGYNATVFAYGQTGAGKTFTMQGPAEECDWESEVRGLIPRTLKYLFRRLTRLKTEFGEKVQFSLECTLVEIYNEQVYDLMVPLSNQNLNVREKKDNTVYLEGVVKVPFSSAEGAYEVLQQGWTNRRVASTSMNRESSRSHSLFTLHLETKTFRDDGVIHIKTSKLNLIDLAGSERQKDTNAAGERIKEAGSINKSLSAIGNVIQALVDNSQGKKRHVPYRDSTLSFLLRDSLGGNTKTYIIACIHPGQKTTGESISTLRFASRAKMIKNHAVINEDVEGDKHALQAEIRHLKAQLAHIQSSTESSSSSTKPATTSTSMTDSRNRGSDWKREFVEAMTLWQKLKEEIDDLKIMNRALHVDLQRKNKIKLQHKLMMKFREDRIGELEKLVKTQGSEDALQLVQDKQKEIEALQLRLESLAKGEEKQESAVVVELKQKIKTMMADEHLQQKITANASIAEDLEKKIKALVEENRGDYQSTKSRATVAETEAVAVAAAASAAASAAADVIETLRQQIAACEQKFEAKSDELKSFRIDSESRANKLSEKLKESQESCKEMTNVLNASKLKSQIEKENKNKEYLHTIRSMTPRSGNTPRRGRGGIPMLSLNASLLTSPSPIGAKDVADSAAAAAVASSGVEEETLPSAEEDAVDEHQELIETQRKRIEELTCQIQDLEEAQSKYSETNEALKRANDKLTEDRTRLDESLQALEIEQRNGQIHLEKVSKELKVKEEQLSFAESEAQDYRLLEAQAARRMAEMKTESSTILDGKEHQIEEFESKIAKLESSLQSLSEAKDEALNMASEKSDQIIRLEDEIALTLAAHRSVVAEMEKLKNKDIELVSLAAQLQAELDKEMERNGKLSQEINDRGDEMETRLMEALSEKEATKDRLRLLDDQIDLLRGEKKLVKADLASTRDQLAQAERRVEDLNNVLAQVQEHCALLEETSKKNVERIEGLRKENEDLKLDLEEESSRLEKAFTEAEQIDAALEETRKMLKTQKATHEFNMESLTEDHKCLMEMYDELKAKLEAAEATAEVAKASEKVAESAAEEWKAEIKRREEEEALKKIDAASPGHLDRLVKENEELTGRQSELVRQIQNYESRREEREKIVAELKSKMEGKEMESLLLLQIQAKYESLRTELAFERQKSDEDGKLVVVMTANIDAANCEKDLLNEQCRQFQAELSELRFKAESQTEGIRLKQEELEREVSELRQQRTLWAKDVEEAAEIKEKQKESVALEKAATEQVSYWKQEYEKVQKENGRLMGHQNHKQKINHIVELKNQLTTQKQKFAEIKLENDGLRKRLKNKENRPPFV